MALALWVGGIAVAVLIALAWGRASTAKWRKSLADGSYARQFVRVADDGSAHELEPDEIDYLSTEFIGADGNRPYIKESYGALTPDGRIGGFLKRRELPPSLSVKSLGDATPVSTPAEAIALAEPAFLDWLGPQGATPDHPLSASLDAGVWRVTGTWQAADGGLFVDISGISGRVMRTGVTSPRSIRLPLGADGACLVEHYIGGS